MKNKIAPVSQLAEVGACFDAREWVRSSRVRSLESAWLKCERGDWLLWYAAKRGVDRRTVVLAACECARLALPHAKSDVARICIETAEAWARGEATIEQVREARNRAYAEAAAYAAAVYADERKQALAQCAQIVRKHIPTLPQ